MLSVRILGTASFRLHGDERSQLATGRTAALLAYLITTNQPQSRAVLGNLLWNAKSEQQARSNLRYALRDVRREVGDYVLVNGESVAFNRSLPHWVDSLTFASHIKALSARQPAKESRLIQDMLGLYTGEFLAGIQINDAPVFEEWLSAQRRHLHELFVLGLNLSVQEQMATAEYETALELNNYLLSLEPWREEAHRQRMELFAHLGQRSAALKQYELCLQALKEELDVPPMPQTTSLYEQIKSGHWFSGKQMSSLQTTVPTFPQRHVLAHGQFSASPAAAGRQERQMRFDLGSMPEPLYFVGRERELATLDQWIGQERCRLVTIHGLAGQGKSALAAAFVQRAIEAIEEASPAVYAFTEIIWRSLDDTISCVDMLKSWLVHLEGVERASLPSNYDELSSRLFSRLKSQRSLLVLDGADTLASMPQAEATAYQRIFHLFHQRQHNSCLLLTSCSRSIGLTSLGERDKAFRRLPLDGLSPAESISLLISFGLGSDKELLEQFYDHYAGNPLLTTQAANLVHELFAGEPAAFVQEKLFFLDEISHRLHSQFMAHSPLERKLLHILAEADEALTRASLWQCVQPAPERSAFLLALRSLRNSSLLDQQGENFRLPAVLVAFLREHRAARAQTDDLPISTSVPR